MCRTTLSWRHSIGMGGTKHLRKRLVNVQSLVLCHTNSCSYYHFEGLIFNISKKLYGPRFSTRRVVGWLHSNTECDWTVCNVSFVNVRQQIKWHHAQDTVSLTILYKFANFNTALVFCLKFAFTEILHKLITYTVGWCKTCIRSRQSHYYSLIPRLVTAGSHNRLDLIKSLAPTHYVCNWYLSMFF